MHIAVPHMIKNTGCFMQRTIIYAEDTTMHERAHAKRMARCALINAPNSEELTHMMARASTYQLTRMTDHTWTGCTCVKCSALLGSERRGRDVSLTWNAWCPLLFCVSITVPNNRRVWRVAADQTRVTQAVSAQPSVCPSLSLCLSSPSCSQPPPVSPLMLSSVFVSEAAWESAQERRHHHLCLALLRLVVTQT